MRPALALTCALLLAAGVYAQDYAADIPVDHPAIQYYKDALNDPISRLVKQIESGKITLDFTGDRFGYLPSLLKSVGVNPDSQALVFSKTSFQSQRISPTHPRAVYFGDDVAIGFVPGTAEVEIAATDPRQGTVFYTMKMEKGDKPVIARQQVCLKCHQGPATSGVPGIFVGSVFPGPSGLPSRTQTAIITDHRTKFEDRWGGWYINAMRGQQRDRANSVASNPAAPEELDPVPQNVPKFFGKFKEENYLGPQSDIVSLITFEHQTQMTNFITRFGWQARIAEQTPRPIELTRLDADLDAMINYMFFADEEPLKEPVEGVSTFTKNFQLRGPRDRSGRSLRDFDLKTRLFRYRLSYVIYTEQFDALPANVRERLYRRIHDVLTGKDLTPKLAKIPANERRAILEIVRDTKSNLPAYW